jgi:predicted metal-dependent phosphoesterase TrpH
MNGKTDARLKVELHVHTYGSKDSLLNPKKVLERCERLGIDRVAITDHNAIDAAQKLKAFAPNRVIVGEEIQTTQGEILGYFMKELVPEGLTPQDTIKRLRQQGAFISVAHPLDTIRSAQWTEAQLRAIAPAVDALETFNARCLKPEFNTDALSFARSQGLLETVGSDAHSLFELGRANLLMDDFWDAESFQNSLASAEKITRLSPIFVHFFSRYAAMYKKLKNKFK